MKTNTNSHLIRSMGLVQLPLNFTVDTGTNALKNEPMLFNCDWDSAWRLGGQLTRNWLEQLPVGWQSGDGPVVIDTRVHMLMRGWYPCIPGWHHDDVIRDRADGQPNYLSDFRSEHAMTLINSDVAPTQFASGTDTFVETTDGTPFYGKWHTQVQANVDSGMFLLEQARNNHLIFFNDRVWHQGVAAQQDGWRWFARISRYYHGNTRVDRGNARTNETRRQVQVYLENPTKGW